MHFDRLLTIHFFQHLMKLLPKSKGIQIPILMYHSISDGKEGGHPYYWINTSANLFYEHMKYLKFNNYKVISLSEAVTLINKKDESIKPNKPDGSKYVVLTFDDGYRDFYKTAWPILLQFGFRATVFLPTAFMGCSFKNRQFLSWFEVRELYSQGVFLGSHTVTHPQLYGLSWDEIKFELENSKKTLEDHIGARIEDFSYPFAYPENDRPFCKRLAYMLLKCGYTRCVTTRLGCSTPSDDLLNLRRLPINSADDPAYFKTKLEGGYDWLAVVQRTFKVLRRTMRLEKSWSNLIEHPASKVRNTMFHNL